jgi:hypothetical protein
VPRDYVDYRGVPLLGAFPQPETFGTDTIADMYEARVVLNDVRDMYTKTRVDQTPLEAATWSKEASAPYPPAVLLAEAALYAGGERTGIGFYGMVLMLAMTFIALSAWYFVRTRWYLFPLVYLNFAYFAQRFVYVQDGSYLVMLTVVVIALLAARRRPALTHLLMATATTMKLSPLFYVVHTRAMTRRSAWAYVAVLIAGLILPYWIWDNYLYIYRYGNELKGDWETMAGALALAGPFAVVLWYVDVRLGFTWEDRVGWGLVPFAMFLGLKTNAARHLLIALLVPDPRGWRNAVLAVALALPLLLPSVVRFNSTLLIASALLIGVLVRFLGQIGWATVRADLRAPAATLRMLIGRRPVEVRAIPTRLD